MRNTTIALALIALCSVSHAQQRSKLLDIGESAPEWKDLEATDGKSYSLNSFKEDALVVCFTCNSCPYSVDYEDRLISLQKMFEQQKLSAKLIAINSNTIDADQMDKMKDRSKQKEFNFPYLWDESQQVARDYGAIYTPEFFVFNKERELIYKGAMDDSTKADRVEARYVEDAVKATLSGKTPSVSKSGARGCAIRFKRKRR